MFATDLFAAQRVIVTGGGTGIGRQTVLDLASLGARVAICGRRIEPLQAVQAEVRALGGECVAQPCDIRDPEQIAAFVEGVGQALGGCDILINNAGGQFPMPAESLSPRGWEAVIRNNLNGTFFMTREVATQLMIPAQEGRIINVIANIERGFPGMAHTGAARAGVENLTKTLAIEWARHGITTVALAPGIVRTSGTRQYPDELVEMQRQATPVKRVATCQEIAHILVFLASPAARFITGCTLKADGGASIWGESWAVPDWPNEQS